MAQTTIQKQKEQYRDYTADTIHNTLLHVFPNNAEKDRHLKKYIQDILRMTKTTYEIAAAATFYMFRFKHSRDGNPLETLVEHLDYDMEDVKSYTECHRKMFLAALMVARGDTVSIETWKDKCGNSEDNLEAYKNIFFAIIGDSNIKPSVWNRWLKLCDKHIQDLIMLSRANR